MQTSVVTVSLEVSEPDALLERLYPNGKLGGVTVSGKSPGALGQHVLLTVRVRRPTRREFTLRGQLAWARYKASKALGASFGIDFLPEDDATRQRLLAFARQEVGSEATRFEPRVQVELSVRLVHAGRLRREFLADLSPGGAFIRTWDPIPLDERVELVVRGPLQLRALRLQGRVAWLRQTGDDPGMGIEFIERDDATRHRISDLIAKLTS